MMWDWNPSLTYPEATDPALLNIPYADEPLLPLLLDRPREPAMLDQGLQFWL